VASIAGQGVARDIVTCEVTRDVGFPGRTVTGLCMIIGSILPIGVYHAKGVDFAAGMAAHHLRTGFSGATLALLPLGLQLLRGHALAHAASA